MKSSGAKYGAGRAFTLIELLVVVAIIALLISILLPSLAKAREQGRRVKCAANMKSILLASATYLSTTNSYVHPELFPEQLCAEKWVWSTAPLLLLSGEKCMGAGESSTVWDCPNNAKKRRITPLPGIYPGKGGAGGWKDPNRQGWDQRYEFLSYGGNDWGLGEADWNTGLMWPATDGSPWGIKESMVKMPAEFICFTESNRDGAWDQLAVQDLNDWCRPTENTGAIHPINATFGANVGFFDSHVVWMPTYKVYSLDNPVYDGIMLSDYLPLSAKERSRWRVMWSRDHKPHGESNSGIPGDYLIGN